MKDEFNEFESALWDVIVDLGRVEKSKEKTKEDLADLQRQLMRANEWINNALDDESYGCQK